MATPSKQDRADFEAFCKAATAAQLCQIVAKERAANRRVYLEIAERVQGDRQS